MIEDGSMPEATTLAENLAVALFESGKVAMCPFGPWMLSELGNNEYVAENCDVRFFRHTKEHGSAYPTALDGMPLQIRRNKRRHGNCWNTSGLRRLRRSRWIWELQYLLISALPGDGQSARS